MLQRGSVLTRAREVHISHRTQCPGKINQLVRCDAHVASLHESTNSDNKRFVYAPRHGPCIFLNRATGTLGRLVSKNDRCDPLDSRRLRLDTCFGMIVERIIL